MLIFNVNSWFYNIKIFITTVDTQLFVLRIPGNFYRNNNKLYWKSPTHLFLSKYSHSNEFIFFFNRETKFPHMCFSIDQNNCLLFLSNFSEARFSPITNYQQTNFLQFYIIFSQTFPFMISPFYFWFYSSKQSFHDKIFLYLFFSRFVSAELKTLHFELYTHNTFARLCFFFLFSFNSKRI